MVLLFCFVIFVILFVCYFLFFVFHSVDFFQNIFVVPRYSPEEVNITDYLRCGKALSTVIR